MAAETKAGVLNISSPAFQHDDMIPSKYTCEGENVNPPLQIANIPPDTRCLALIMEDPDAPNGTFDHWIMWNIPVDNTIREGSVPGISGTNSFGKTGYGGPCPPSGTHRYYITIYALEQEPDLEPGADKNALLEAMGDHVLATGLIMGRYRKTK